MYDADYSGFRPDSYFLRRVQEEVAARIVPKLDPGSRILDVGCGNGEFLHTARVAGFQAEGIDVSAAAVEVCRRRGLNAWQGDFLCTGRAASYDLVTMWDVIEHLPEPRAFVRRSFELLRPGGWLLIKTPRNGQLAIRLSRLATRAANILVQYPSHIQFFSPQSLGTLLRGEGFGQLEWFPCKRMRARGAGKGLRKSMARLACLTVGVLSRSGNCYVMARKPAAGRLIDVA
jgi:2-polyprenyl-3-methyl-5-hydroxy-6-metoxy-1,4-benzoquinol methylase